MTSLHQQQQQHYDDEETGLRTTTASPQHDPVPRYSFQEGREEAIPAEPAPLATPSSCAQTVSRGIGLLVGCCLQFLTLLICHQPLLVGIERKLACLALLGSLGLGAWALFRRVVKHVYKNGARHYLVDNNATTNTAECCDEQVAIQDLLLQMDKRLTQGVLVGLYFGWMLLLRRRLEHHVAE